MSARHLLLLATLAGPVQLQAQADLENVIVETYYISDANDATDLIGGGLATGSRTYRVFVDLCDSCALRALYGDVPHPLNISSTANFFNNADRGRTFGHEINNGALDENTVALDSWFSVGAGSNQKFGVLKEGDPDGSILGGNDGGSAMIPGGLLQNADPLAGAPLDSLDGLVPLNGGTALPAGFAVTGTSPDSLFRDSTAGNAFITWDTRISCIAPGVRGPSPDNRILIGQFTTAGELSFCLNIEVQRADGTIIKYVCSDTLLQPGEVASGLLQYPPVCGCTDPDFLEFDPTAGCDDGSCATPIVFGCLDTLACNFDPTANFPVAQLCCYGPDNCNGLDITLVCPDVSVDAPITGRSEWTFRPNPVRDDVVIVDWNGAPAGVVRVLDGVGRTVLVARLDGAPQGQVHLDVAQLPPGPYLIRLEGPGSIRTGRLIRE
ncbi:MAG TPA: T9SS type A sorting domain-containing protein [Flavobacteriales bacterium]|nr:T9SS type A sorting domain-containing protein [Flavobacteriales bacterium]HMR26229.1 T9SS type A sorting domain-containing protein [Flavobacteriales bacterium]